VKLIFPFGRAFRAEAVNGDVVMIHLEAFGSGHGGGILLQRHIKNLAAGIAGIMAMILHVRAKARRAPLKLDLTDQAALDEGVEAIINRRVRDFRHLLFGADEDFFGRRVIPLVQDHVINLLALRRETKTARAQLFSQVLFGLVMGGAHRESQV
jgi:hypothetical protein